MTRKMITFSSSDIPQGAPERSSLPSYPLGNAITSLIDSAPGNIAISLSTPAKINNMYLFQLNKSYQNFSVLVTEFWKKKLSRGFV